MKFEITGQVTYVFSAVVEAADMDEAMSKRMDGFDNMDLDEATAKWDLDEIAEIEDDEDDEALSKLAESSADTAHST
jgi:hypothetical protein